MKLLTIIMVVFLTASCNRRICSSEAKINMGVFQKQLNLITNYEDGDSIILVDKYRQALFFMSFITAIDAKAEYSSTIGYLNKEDYRKNIHDWKKWYKNNKCILTDHYIDSMYKKIGLIYNKHSF